MQITRTLYLAGDETQSLDELKTLQHRTEVMNTLLHLDNFRASRASDGLGELSGDSLREVSLVFSNGGISTHATSPCRFMALA